MAIPCKIEKTKYGQNYFFTLKVIVVFLIHFYIITPVQSQNFFSYKSDSLTLYYEQYGKGPAMYILSGGPGEAPYYPYRQIADSLSSSYTCIIVHQRGTGKSANLPINEKTITVQQYTRDLEALRRHRGDKKIALLGVSWGGMLAMDYAANYPEFTDDLILVCSGPPSYKLWNVLYDNQFARRSVAEVDSMAALQKIFSAKSEKELDSLKRVCPDCPEVLAYKEFIIFHVRAMYYDRRKVSRAMYEQAFYDFNFQVIPIIDKEIMETRYDISEKLKKLDIPALIVYGRQDDQGESTFYLQQECLKNSQTRVIEQCGHEILEEQPEAFFKILREYISRDRK